MARGRAFLTTSPRCNPEQHTAPVLCSEQGPQQGFSSPGSSQLSCRDVSPRCLSRHPGRADAVAGSLALSLSPAQASLGLPSQGFPQEACRLIARRHRLLPQADSSFRSALLLSPPALLPPTCPPGPFTPHPRTLLLFTPWAAPTIPPSSTILAPGITDLLAWNVLGPGCSGSKMRWLT